MQRICLGAGIVAEDARFVQFTEEDQFGSAPGYLASSVWDLSAYDAICGYIRRLLGDLSKEPGHSSKEPGPSRCVVLVPLENGRSNLIL